MWSFRPFFLSGLAVLLILIWSGDQLFFFLILFDLDHFVVWLSLTTQERRRDALPLQRLEFYFDINACRQVQTHECIGCGWCWIVYVDKTLVNANFKVLA